MARPSALLGVLVATIAAVTTLPAAARGPSSTSSGKPRPSLQTVESQQLLLVLDEQEREQRRRRETLARLTADERAHERRDRLAIFAVVAVAGVTAIYVERRRRERAR